MSQNQSNVRYEVVANLKFEIWNMLNVKASLVKLGEKNVLGSNYEDATCTK